MHNCGNTTEATTLLQQFIKKKKKSHNNNNNTTQEDDTAEQQGRGMEMLAYKMAEKEYNEKVQKEIEEIESRYVKRDASRQPTHKRTTYSHFCFFFFFPFFST